MDTLVPDNPFLQKKSKIRDSARDLQRLKKKENVENDLIGVAGQTLGVDLTVESQIADKFKAFESDGKSDADDLDERFDIFMQ